VGNILLKLMLLVSSDKKRCNYLATNTPYIKLMILLEITYDIQLLRRNHL